MSAELGSTEDHPLRVVDRDLLRVLRGAGSVGIGDLTEALGVTATAIRQRIERLLQLELIERDKVVSGRGRPTYQYRLSPKGFRQAGANANALAEAMWQEILAIKDAQVRTDVIAAVAARLGREYAEQLECEAEDTFEDRLTKLSAVLAKRQIDNQVITDGGLPVLDIGACPYPALTDASEDRAMCRLEEQMISEALGKPVHLSSCRLDGDSCCQFSSDSD